YEGADDPDHSAAGFPTDCALCHEITDWNDGEFNHTFFDLSGGHAAVDCSQCHIGGVYEGTSDVCYACHESDYEGADDPDHSAAGFPTDCTLCHDLSGWENSNFDHSFFDLWGGHAEVDCSQCHIGGVYEGTSSECYDCHFDDYNMADDPNHLGTAFPTDCTFCHDLSGWGEGEFTHWPPYFPITSGPHSDEWDQCTECHTNPQNFGEFDCLACHPHSNQNQMDGRHHWVPDYEYDSDACYACHPDGEVHK
ncbi:MAG: hypothetical protein KJ831_05975, partial [Candidatus Eisenbacteria bacterium]|nr:hypothetical protein [Candidatus Eisenbacteria bacterium]